MTKLYKNIDGVRLELTSEEVEVFHGEWKENEKKAFELTKKLKLEELRKNNEEYIYSVYPEYKQRNIGIYGTEEERENFRVFKENQILWYDEKVGEINECETVEEIDGIVISIDLYSFRGKISLI
jgi:hypothetical protein